MTNCNCKDGLKKMHAELRQMFAIHKDELMMKGLDWKDNSLCVELENSIHHVNLAIQSCEH